MIHQDELAHVRQQVEDLKATDEIKVPEPMQKDLDYDALIRREAIRFYQTCPNLWDYLNQSTIPRPHIGRNMMPGVAMSFGELAAYNMGQHSIHLMLQAMVDKKEEGEPE